MNTKNFEKFSPIDFLKISEEINKYSDILNVNDSSIERTIFGRLYYASFLYAREWLSKNYGYKSKGPADHKNLPYFIKKHGPFDRIGNIRISDSLKELKKMRHQSDYYLKIPKKESKEYDRWNFGDINRAFELARDIFDSFENSK